VVEELSVTGPEPMLLPVESFTSDPFALSPAVRKLATENAFQDAAIVPDTAALDTPTAPLTAPEAFLVEIETL
jgi:hypothetical protein